MPRKEPTPFQKRLLALVDETVAYYGADPKGRRATEDGCVYYDEETKRRCAFGRLIPEEEAIRLSKAKKGDLNGEGVEEVFSFLEKSSRSRRYYPKTWALLTEVGQFFLTRLQDLHDAHQHWGKVKGLSNSGRKVQALIKRQILDGLFEEVHNRG